MSVRYMPFDIFRIEWGKAVSVLRQGSREARAYREYMEKKRARKETKIIPKAEIPRGYIY